MSDKRRHIVQHRKNQHDLQGSKLGQLFQDIKQQLAGCSIQPDERIVHDENTRSCEQRLRQLKLTKFAAGKENDFLIEHRFDTEKSE